ncbi:MAG: zf-HC2 domain-containing protein [Chloroflexi bacterium]|nr:zf-HC2 domain-containing protein [Chloroflexota bacterium]
MTFRGDHVDELISASLTGDLTDAERAELDAHLARCERCRATLAAFKAERRILSGLPPAAPPSDLPARVRSGIESGRLGVPWWRRPGGLVAIGASAVTVAAVVLGLVVLNNRPAPTGQATGSPEATLSMAPSASAAESSAPSAGPSAPPTFLAAGQLGYLELSGAPLEAGKLSFINDATGASISAGTVSGPPIAASLSPDGQWLAYITQKGETGANEVWAQHLTDGAVTPLGCSQAVPFTDRLAWSPDSAYLAYTLVAVDLGPGAGCPKNDSSPGSAGVGVYLVPGYEPTMVVGGGNAYAGSFVPGSVFGEGEPPPLLVSRAAETPWTTPGVLFSEPGPDIDGVFLPLISPEGNRALFWSGSMASTGGIWQFSLGGMPQLSGDFRATGPASPWLGTPLFTDLTPVGGEAFAYGSFAWGPDSDLFAFWDGAWTGTPQSADGTYPSQQDVYIGRISTGLLSKASKLGLLRPDDSFIVDVAFSPDGTIVAVTIGLPSAGIGDPPSAYLEILPLNGSTPYTVGGGVDPPPWDGPAVFGR